MSSASISPARAGQLARLRGHAAARMRAALAQLTKPAPVARLLEMPLMVAGLGCVDAGAFVGNEIAGLVVTGLSLIGLEYLIADDE